MEALPHNKTVIAGLVPANQGVSLALQFVALDARNKSGHDKESVERP